MFSFSPLLLAAALTATGDLQLLEFTATWCGPCQAMQPVIEQLQAQGYTVRPIDIDQHRELASQFQVTRVPTFILVAGREPVGRLEGAASAEQLQALFRQHANRPAAPVAAAPTAAAGPTPPTGRAGAVAGPANAVEQQAMRASVRLRVEDPDGQSYGTGTIVDVHGQEALILTCGHLFRDSGGRGRIVVDLCADSGQQSVTGELIQYELQPDVALVSIRTRAPVVAARIAGPTYVASPNTPVFSVGCNHGEPPTIVRGQVTAINKYLGPANLVASGRPVDGRSGGGLFSADGYLIGICNAADPQLDEGLYAAYPTIHQQLDRANLAFIYRGAATEAVAATPPDASVRPAARQPDSEGPAVQAASADAADPSFAPTALAATPSSDDTEVILILRSRTDPRAQCQVLVVDQPSSDLIARLRRESQLQGNPRPTDLRVSAAAAASQPVSRAQRPLPTPRATTNDRGVQPTLFHSGR